MITNENFDYSEKKQELEQVMRWFEGNEVSIEESIEKYEEAKKIINELEGYLAKKKKSIDLVIKNGDNS
jgi:exodeoxyribonuclease VII small subunit